MKIRHFLPACLVFISSLPLSAQKDFIGNATPPSHPRLLLLKGEESSIKKAVSSDKVWGNTQQAIIEESDRMLSTVPVERIKIGRRLLDKSREALRRIFFLSYAYRTTGDIKYAQRAEKEMLAVSAFGDWNPSHFLDVAEMTMAVAIGYDWLHSYLPESSRKTISSAIIKNGIEPSLVPANNGWLKAENNWNQVCNAGMTFGALAIYEDNPTLAKQIINRSVETVVASMTDLAPDGGYPEGYMYWNYGTSFNVLLINALDKAFGTDYGLSAMPGFMKTAAWVENMTGPTGRPFNYSDANNGEGVQPAMFWFAAKNGDPTLLWMEKSRLVKEDIRNQMSDRILPAMMLWGTSTNINSIKPPKELMWTGKGKNPVALMRNSWTDTGAVFVAFKGGSPSINHAHMDVGSFVMDAAGVRWAMDFGMQSYESLESKGMNIFGRTQDAQRWTIFRYVNEAHNTLTINDKKQWVAGWATLSNISTNKNFMSAQADLSDVYKGTVSSVKRGIALVDQRYVVVRDEITAKDTATTVRWTMLTPGNVKVTGKNSVILTKDGQELEMRVAEPANITIKTWPTDPPPNSYDAPNPGTTRTGFELSVPANSSTGIVVYLIPASAKGAKTATVPALASWMHD